MVSFSAETPSSVDVVEVSVVVVVLIEEVSFDVDVGSVEVFDVVVGSVEAFDVVVGEEDSFVVDDDEFFTVEVEDVLLSFVDEELFPGGVVDESLFEGLKSDFDEVMERGSDAEDNEEPGRLSLSIGDLGR